MIMREKSKGSSSVYIMSNHAMNKMITLQRVCVIAVPTNLTF